MYRHRGLLECQVSRPNAHVRWYKNRKELLPGKKYQLISQDVYRQLTIEDVCSSDEDTYTCDAVDDKTSCQLLVEGGMLLSVQCVAFTCYGVFYFHLPNCMNSNTFELLDKILEEMCLAVI